MTHTQEPWTIADDGTIEARHQGRVGQLKDAGYADTALIQAAPELLAALKVCESVLRIQGYVNAADVASAAIAKATGEKA